MSDTFSADEIYILDLAEDQTPSDFRGEPSRKWPGVTRRLRPTAVKVRELAASVKLFMQKMETLLADNPQPTGGIRVCRVRGLGRHRSRREIDPAGRRQHRGRRRGQPQVRL